MVTIEQMPGRGHRRSLSVRAHRAGPPPVRRMATAARDVDDRISYVFGWPADHHHPSVCVIKRHAAVSIVGVDYRCRFRRRRSSGQTPVYEDAGEHRRLGYPSQPAAPLARHREAPVIRLRAQ